MPAGNACHFWVSEIELMPDAPETAPSSDEKLDCDHASTSGLRSVDLISRYGVFGSAEHPVGGENRRIYGLTPTWTTTPEPTRTRRSATSPTRFCYRRWPSCMQAAVQPPIRPACNEPRTWSYQIRSAPQAMLSAGQPSRVSRVGSTTSIPPAVHKSPRHLAGCCPA